MGYAGWEAHFLDSSCTIAFEGRRMTQSCAFHAGKDRRVVEMVVECFFSDGQLNNEHYGHFYHLSLRSLSIDCFSGKRHAHS